MKEIETVPAALSHKSNRVVLSYPMNFNAIRCKCLSESPCASLRPVYLPPAACSITQSTHRACSPSHATIEGAPAATAPAKFNTRG